MLYCVLGFELNNECGDEAIKAMKLKVTASKLMIFLVLLTLSGCTDSEGIGTSQKNAPANLAIGTVEVKIVFGSERESIQGEVDCMGDSTVFSVLQAAADEMGFAVESTGVLKGDKFITSIGGVENLAGDGKNWIYRVNGVLGDKGSGVFAVKPQDKVVWSFGKYEPE